MSNEFFIYYRNEDYIPTYVERDFSASPLCPDSPTSTIPHIFDEIGMEEPPSDSDFDYMSQPPSPQPHTILHDLSADYPLAEPSEDDDDWESELDEAVEEDYQSDPTFTTTSTAPTFAQPSVNTRLFPSPCARSHPPLPSYPCPFVRCMLCDSVVHCKFCDLEFGCDC